MLPKVAIGSLLLLSVLWIDVAWTGSSFLSPEHPKTQRKESKKPPAKLQPRDMEDPFSQPGGVEKGLEIQVGAGSDDAQRAQGKEEQVRKKDGSFIIPGTVSEFNAPFDIGIKVAEAQYQQYGHALEKVLQEILLDENQGNRGEN
ncbi:appetite-regulating hormone isoform X2 [Sminthopsis crassicaudata]